MAIYPNTVRTIYINLHPFSLGQWHIRCDDVTNYEKDEMTSGWTYRLQRFAVEEVHREISLGLWLFPAVSVSYVIIMGHDFDVLRSKFKTYSESFAYFLPNTGILQQARVSQKKQYKVVCQKLSLISACPTWFQMLYISFHTYVHICIYNNLHFTYNIDNPKETKA